MKRSGFIIGEHLLGFTIVIVGAIFFVMEFQALLSQKKSMEERVVAARICMEQTRSGNFAADQSYRVQQFSNGIIVWHHHRQILKIEK